MRLDIDLLLNFIALAFLIVVLTMLILEKIMHKRKMENQEAKSNAKIRQS